MSQQYTTLLILQGPNVHIFVMNFKTYSFHKNGVKKISFEFEIIFFLDLAVSFKRKPGAQFYNGI